MERSPPAKTSPAAPIPSPTPSSSTGSPSGDDSGAGRSAEQTGPHGALFLVLGYLRLPELLAFQGACRLFRDVIAGDPLLWQHIAVEPPLSGKLTDDALSKITSKAEGKLKYLALLDCWKITDSGLLQVADRNPGITKLYVPGCIYLSADGVVKVVKRLFEQGGNLKHLQLRGICYITKEHLDVLNSFLHKNNPHQFSQPSFYGHIVPFNSDDGRSLDVDMCPKCKNVNTVFDCTRENCRMMKSRWSECRGCFFCIARCEECGGCIEEPGEKAICLHFLCLQCWLRLPKCNMCNQPYCSWHANLYGSSSMLAGFVCDQCRELGISSYHSASGNWETFA